jgi:cytochrome c oxidase subunit 4
VTDHARSEPHASGARGAAHRRQYLVVFVVLAVLTVVELGVASTTGIPGTAALVAFVLLALAKAALIALFYMHLRFETRVLRATALAPLFAPAAYGVILIAEAATRSLR